MSTILITGGAGYIGATVAHLLESAAYQIIILDNLSTGKEEYISPKAVKIIGDAGDKELVDRVFKENKIDAVIHLAARLEVGESVSMPFEYLQTNVAATACLLEVMRKHRVTRLLFSSTGSIYGDQALPAIPEFADKNPANPYSLSKYLAEQWISHYAHTYGFDAVIFRYFNACGAWPEKGIYDTHGASHLVPILLEAASGKRDKLIINGSDYTTIDGTCVRDYIHIRDIAEAHLLAVDLLIKGKLAGNHVYNIGTGKGLSVVETVAALEKILGREIPKTFGPRRAGDVAQTVADTTAIKKDLGFEPKFSDVDRIFEGLL